MGSFSSFNCGVKNLLCAIDVFTKYALVKCLEDEKSKRVLDSFVEMVNESKRQPHKIMG